MALPDVVTREQWLAARTELLADHPARYVRPILGGGLPGLHGADPTFTD